VKRCGRAQKIAGRYQPEYDIHELKKVRHKMKEQDFFCNDTLLSEIVQCLATVFQPERIYLFGSRARGSEGLSSDYDILVVMPSLTEPAYRYSQRAYQVLSNIPAAKDILFMSKEKFEYWRDTLGSLAELVNRQGKELYVTAA
jgi:predicted nucleotidyltransferase